MKPLMKQLLLIGMALQIGCGGGSDSEPTPTQSSGGPLPLKILLAVPDGTWQGTAMDSLGQEKTVRAFVVDRQAIQFEVAPPQSQALALLGPGSWFIASIEQCCAPASTPVIARTSSLGGAPGTALITVSHSYAGPLTATIEYANQTYQVSLERDRTRPELISMQTLAGVYSGTYSASIGTPTSWTLTIESGGRVTGNDSFGCSWSGTAATSLSGVNAFKLVLEATGCAGAAQVITPISGNYVAMGRFSEAEPTRTRYPGQPVIDFTIVGPVWLGRQMLAR
jgi:hypothetical protein